ncbi:hypothetical protein GCM10023093_00240 [Nemorincola caseinilytica]|uniref:Lipoprotein n=1 Tax=Nemorincola caseinilytica TaxID=2054315 RepID=A0ABP8N3S6_9BACT
MIGKKTYCLVAAAVLTLAYASCKKDSNCECTIRRYDPYTNTTTVQKVSENIYTGKASAPEKCAAKAPAIDTSDYLYVTCIIN